MALTGTLDDASVAELLQFIDQSQRSGSLFVRREDEHVEVHFHRGHIVSARGTNIARLGEIVLEHGLIDQKTFDMALVMQDEIESSTGERPVIGEVLLTMGATTPRALRHAVETHIQASIVEVLTWTAGRFEFERRDIKLITGFEKTPGEILPDIDINTQMIVLEAARLFDQKNREESEANGGDDSDEEEFDITPPPVVAGTKKKERPAPDSIRTGHLSPEASLVLLKILSESLERVLLFLVRTNSIDAVGGFGFSIPDRKPLAQVTRAMRLPLDEENSLVATLSGGKPETFTLTEAPLPEKLLKKIGPPASDEYVVFPVKSQDQTVLVVYADNGIESREIKETELLEITAERVGVAIEDEEAAAGA